MDWTTTITLYSTCLSCCGLSLCFAGNRKNNGNKNFYWSIKEDLPREQNDVRDWEDGSKINEHMSEGVQLS